VKKGQNALQSIPLKRKGKRGARGMDFGRLTLEGDFEEGKV
jgi:hypothetical protein